MIYKSTKSLSEACETVEKLIKDISTFGLSLHSAVWDRNEKKVAEVLKACKQSVDFLDPRVRIINLYLY